MSGAIRCRLGVALAMWQDANAPTVIHANMKFRYAISAVALVVASLANSGEAPYMQAAGAEIPEQQLPELKKKALAGDIAAANHLAKHYGAFVADDQQRDFWLRIAAEHGDCGAMDDLIYLQQGRPKPNQVELAFLRKMQSQHRCAVLPNSEAQAEIDFNLDAVFQRKDFLPHIPLDTQVVRTYGKGNVVVLQETKYRLYSTQVAGQCVAIRINTDSSPEWHAADGVFMTSGKRCNGAAVPAREIHAEDLQGVRLGDSEKSAMAAFGTPATIFEGKILSSTAKVIEYFPAPLNSGICLRLYSSSGRIIGFSVSVEE